MSVHVIERSGVRLSRIGYVDTPVPPEVVGLDAAQVAAVPWAAPHWASAPGDAAVTVTVGAAIWIAEIAGKRIALDPVQAADAVLRAGRATEARHQFGVAGVLAREGFARESIDLVAMTHIEGVGMVAWRDDDGGWQPFFPNARILVSDEVLMAFLGAPPENDEAAAQDLQYSAWSALIEQGRVATFGDGEEIVPGMRAQVLGGHCAGHTVFHFADRDASHPIAFLGHLAVSPLHLATGPCAALNEQPDDAWATLQGVAAAVPTLVGPLWPSPGYGRWQQDQLAPGG